GQLRRAEKRLGGRRSSRRQERPQACAGENRDRQRQQSRDPGRREGRRQGRPAVLMREAVVQSFENLRANKLRSFLTMFGILWGMISVVVLSFTGEGFRQGNDKVLRELGKNIGIVWCGGTSLEAGGERGGRGIRLTLDDARG